MAVRCGPVFAFSLALTHLRLPPFQPLLETAMPHATQATDECAATIGASDPMATQPHAAVEQPLLFGRYRTVRELGRGGMGIVLLAHDIVLDLQVALKLIPQNVVRDTEGIIDLKKEVLRG